MNLNQIQLKKELIEGALVGRSDCTSIEGLIDFASNLI